MAQRAGADPLLSHTAALTNTQLYDFSGHGGGGGGEGRREGGKKDEEKERLFGAR